MQDIPVQQITPNPLQPSSVLIYAAALTPCDCHPGSGALELEALYESSIEAIPNE